MFGSLSIIWPWKNAITNPNTLDRHGEEMIIGYTRYIPSSLDADTLQAIICIVIGIMCIGGIEKMAEKKNK